MSGGMDTHTETGANIHVQYSTHSLKYCIFSCSLSVSGDVVSNDRLVDGNERNIRGVVRKVYSLDWFMMWSQCWLFTGLDCNVCVCVSECILFFNRNDRYCTISGINTRFYTLFLFLCTAEGWFDARFLHVFSFVYWRHGQTKARGPDAVRSAF